MLFETLHGQRAAGDHTLQQQIAIAVLQQ